MAPACGGAQIWQCGCLERGSGSRLETAMKTDPGDGMAMARVMGLLWLPGPAHGFEGP
jgi:hypothetical protein